MPDERDLTYGELAVGLTFNPSGADDVHAIKSQYAAIIDHMDNNRKHCSGEKARLYSVAITEAQTAQMWAVKALTWKDY